MKFFAAMVVFAALACVSRAKATNDSPLISFGPFPIQPVRIYISSTDAASATKAERHFPGASNEFPYIEVGFRHPARYPPLGDGLRRFIPADNLLRVYNITAAQNGSYKIFQSHFDRLHKLLKSRPAKPPNAGKQGDDWNRDDVLPDYPWRNAAHLLEVKISYLDAPWGSGIFYVTQFVQGLGEVPNNEQLTCLFQGLSKDAKHFVSVDVKITHPKIPKDGPDDRQEAEILTERVERMLEKEPDDSFTPSLRKIREWVSTLKIE